jgi:hypothetical protein
MRNEVIMGRSQEAREREQAAPFPRPLSRRAVVKGLIGMTLTPAGMGCTPANPSPPAISTLRRPTPSPSEQITLNTPVLTYRGHKGSVDAVVWHGMRIASGPDGTDLSGRITQSLLTTEQQVVTRFG